MEKLMIRGLAAEIGGKPILNGVDLEIGPGEIHALMGPNGSGKSTLANVIMGHPSYTVTAGSVTLGDLDLLGLPVHERSLAGVFLAFQYPIEIPGVTVGKFLKRAAEVRAAAGGKNLEIGKFLEKVRADMDFLEMDRAFINRYMNEGFSGGEKKRMEILQLLVLEPRFAIFDETDSGLDIDALKTVSKGIERSRGPAFAGLVITHYRRILDHVKPDAVHIMYRGKIVASGREELVSALEDRGYDWVRQRYGIPEDSDEG